MLTLDIDIFLGIGVMHGCVYIHQISIYRYQSLLNLSLTQTKGMLIPPVALLSLNKNSPHNNNKPKFSAKSACYSEYAFS